MSIGVQVLWTSAVFPGTLAESCIKSEKAGIQSNDHMKCQYGRRPQHTSDVHPGKVIAQVAGFTPITWQNETEFLIPSFNLVQLYLLQACRQ